MTQSGSRFKRTSSPNASNLKASFARWLEFRSPFFREIFMSGCKLLPAALSRLTYRLVCSSLSLPTLQKSLCSKIEGAKNVRSELRTQVRSASESVFWLELRFVRPGFRLDDFPGNRASTFPDLWNNTTKCFKVFHHPGNPRAMLK